MNTCAPSCVTDFSNAHWARGCNIQTRKGGIPYLLFYKCDPDASFAVDTGELSPWTSLENLRQAICQENMYVTGEVLGQKPKGSFTKRRTSSCSPEQTIAGSKTITFQDYNADNTDLLDFDFWGGIVDNKKFLQPGWVTQDDLLYMVTNGWDIEIDEVAEDNSETGLAFKDGIITVNQFSMIVPILVPGIYDFLKNFTTTECYG